MAREQDRAISDAEIGLLLDGELSPSQRGELLARLARDPTRSAEVFAEAQRMDAFRAAQSQRLFPPASAIRQGRRLDQRLRFRRLMRAMQMPVAAAALISVGWIANSITQPLPVRQAGYTADQTFVLAAREALRVAQLDAGPRGSEPQQAKIERLVGMTNIAMPQLPAAWRVLNVQVQPWQGKQSLVLTADTPALGRITLVAAPMNGEDAIPPTSAEDGRIPTVYWQSGGTAYALMGPTSTDRLEREARGIEVANRKNITPRKRG